MLRISVSLTLFAVFVSQPLFAYDHQDPNWAPVSKEIKDLCTKVETLSIPNQDGAASDGNKPKSDCDAFDLYYGFSGKPDYVRARLCASNSTDDFAKNAVLSMLYANGKGIAQNLEIAMHFACELGGSTADIEGTLNHLSRIQKERIQNPNFDFCDDIMSGYMEGICANVQARGSEIEQRNTFDSILAKWTPAEKEAFEPLKKAAGNFADLRSNEEVDRSGTGRAAFEAEELNVQKADFLQSVQKFEAGKAPTYTPKQWQEEDRKLNKIFKKIMATDMSPDERSGNSGGRGTVNKEGIKKTQRAWLAYRDAWADFAKAKYPKYSSESVKAWFTKKRNHMLESFAR